MRSIGEIKAMHSPFWSAWIEYNQRGGFSRSVAGDDIYAAPREGYVVGGVGYMDICSDDLLDWPIFKTMCMAAFKDCAYVPEATGFGGWKDKQGVCHIETHTVLMGHDFAVDLGRYNKQYSIYDLNAKEEIVL